MTSAERAAEIREAPWLSPRVAAVVEGGERRHESVAAGLAALEALDAGDADGARDSGPAPGSSSFTTGRDRSPRRRSSRPSSTPPPSTARRSPSCPSPTRSSGSRKGWSRRPSIGRSSGPRRRRRASVGACSATPSPASRRAAPETWTDEAALLEACKIPVHALPGEPSNLKVTLPADLATCGGRARRRASLECAQPEDRERLRQPSVRPRHPARTRRNRGPGRLPAARPLGWRRRTSCHRRCAARRGRPRRPRAAVPGRPRDAARHRQPAS